MMAIEFETIAISNTKGVDYGYIMCNMSKIDPINRLHNSKLVIEYYSSYYDVSVNKYDVKCGTSL